MPVEETSKVRAWPGATASCSQVTNLNCTVSASKCTSFWLWAHSIVNLVFSGKDIGLDVRRAEFKPQLRDLGTSHFHEYSGPQSLHLCNGASSFQGL